MRMLYVCYEDLSHSIAPTIHIIEVCKNLVRLGHQVILIAPDMGRYQEQKLPFRIKYIPIINLRGLKYLVFSLLLPFYLTFYLLKLRPHCLYIRSATFVSFLGSIWAKVFALAYLVEINGLNPGQPWGSSFFSIMSKIDQIVGEFSIKMVDKVITITVGLKLELCRRYKIREEKIAVVPNGTDVEVFRPLDKKQTKRQLGLDEDTNHICFVGSFYPHHGVEYLVKSVPLVVRQIPKTKFLLIGSGSEKPAIEQMVREKNLGDYVIFIGEIPYHTVPLYINASDVCVMPLIKRPPIAREPSPLKLRDYLACARPVVGTDLPGVGDFLEGVEAGISVPQEDASALARSIIDLIHNPARAQRMGENGRKVVVREYTWAQTAYKIERVLLDIC